MVKKVYFAHPKFTYNTVVPTGLEDALMAEITRALPKELGDDIEILNPNKPEHAEAAAKLFAAGEAGMKVFTDLVDTCDAVVYAPLSFGVVDLTANPAMGAKVKKAAPGYSGEENVFALEYELSAPSEGRQAVKPGSVRLTRLEDGAEAFAVSIGAGITKEVNHALEKQSPLPVFALTYRLDEKDYLVPGSVSVRRVDRLDETKIMSIHTTSAVNQHYRDKYKSAQQSSDLAPRT